MRETARRVTKRLVTGGYGVVHADFRNGYVGHVAPCIASSRRQEWRRGSVGGVNEGTLARCDYGMLGNGDEEDAKARGGGGISTLLCPPETSITPLPQLPALQRVSEQQTAFQDEVRIQHLPRGHGPLQHRLR